MDKAEKLYSKVVIDLFLIRQVNYYVFSEFAYYQAIALNKINCEIQNEEFT